MRKHPNVTRSREQGVALAIALMFLLIMTILGVSGLSNTALQEKMTGNLRDKHLSLEGAESGLRIGEDWLCAQPGKLKPISPSDSASGLYNASQDGTAVWQTVNWDSRNGTVIHPMIFEHLAATPQYIVEEVQEVRGDSLKAGSDVARHGANNRMLYRVTSQSVGGTTSAKSMIQSTFAKK